jgi:hypothetical protein
MKTPILGSAYVARSVNAADARMVNLYPEIVPEAGKEPAFLNRCPGLALIGTAGTGPVRAMWSHQTRGDDFYVASGEEFYQGTARKLGNISGTGPVSIADNGTQLFIACGEKGYIYNESTNQFAEITDPDFPGAVTVCYLDGYFVFNEPNSQKIWVSQLLDGTSIEPLDFASAEGSPDGVVAVINDHKELWVFGTDTTEVWYNAGLADFPLAPIQGAFNEVGCVAAFSVVKLDNSIFWLGSDPRGEGIVYRADGYTAKRVSTHAVEWQIQQYSDITDAVAYSYQQEGHTFYVLNFPTANRTWVYDVSTGAWHERASFNNGILGRHRSNSYCNFQGQAFVGDYENGNVYNMSLYRYQDAYEPQKWIRSWRALPTGQNDLKRSAQHNMQLDIEAGVGLSFTPTAIESGTAYFGTSNNNDTETNAVVTDNGDYLIFNMTVVPEPESTQGEDPEVMLRWSDDGGHTWSNEHWVKIGKIGVYGRRAIWRRLGMTEKIRDRVYEVSMTDPVKTTIMGAELYVTPTNG